MIEEVLRLIESDKIKYTGEKICYYDSTDYIFDIIDDFLLDGEFEKANNCLKESIPYIKELPIVVILAFLTITNFPGNGEILPNRSDFYDECERVLKLTESEERIRKLLEGFKNK